MVVVFLHVRGGKHWDGDGGGRGTKKGGKGNQSSTSRFKKKSLHLMRIERPLSLYS